MEVTDRAAIAAALDRTESELGPLRILVNNAGINMPTDFDKVSDADWDEIPSVNLKGPFVQPVRPAARLAAGGGPSSISASVSGQYGGPRTAHYAASKAGLISLAQVIAAHPPGADKWRVPNVVAAGPIASDMAAAGMAAASVQQAAQNIVLKRPAPPPKSPTRSPSAL